MTLSGELPPVVTDVLEEVELPVDERVLAERVDPQAGLDERGHDLAEAVVPAVLLGHGDRGVRIGIRADVVEGERRPVLPVRVDEPQLARLHALVLERVRDRVDLRDVEATAGSHEMGDDVRPALDVGHPAEDTARRVDEVEVALEDVRQLGQVGSDERRVGDADLARRPGREVDAAWLKSAPVTRAPRRAHDSVSIPKWHWRWSRSSPSTEPISSRS